MRVSRFALVLSDIKTIIMPGQSSLKAYAKGSKCPPNNSEKLRLYNMRFCPYAERPKLVLLAKNIDFEEININLTEKPEWFFEKNPLGLVPALEFDGKLLGESLVICDYLDETYPEISLHPKDPFLKAKNAMLVARFGKFNSAMYKIYRANTSEAKQLFQDATKEIEYIEKELADRGTKFLHGEKPGMVDYMIWPWFERIAALCLGYELEPLSPKKFPKLTAYIAEMWKDPAVTKVAHKPEIMMKFIKSKFEKDTPEYDIGLE